MVLKNVVGVKKNFQPMFQISYIVAIYTRTVLINTIKNYGSEIIANKKDCLIIIMKFPGKLCKGIENIGELVTKTNSWEVGG